MELYRNETAGRLGLGFKCAAFVSALSVLALVASGAGDRGTAETPTHAVAHPDDGTAYQNEAAIDDRRAISAAPTTAP
jgi:hypothetical protein